ncbi:MAG: hypothetical protein COT71_04225 [Candidatus Andersenbacteria bacterium CG10_big_fil_rev_8_21_14_0_10_54_11]|uniref:RlpA-like protein double-psi beta-barrel domain-containing protein n=1 Tax=Candidatus Andersenbacteria bacterium CG10_big_fil_rev_8_21_14_0_10_54_11 TaxID=1974485 RepID=A0A2M6WYA8_9BACT|nr:MAG: hypothetical protein COT71_04225 [Candidatus Andersenbacteria bacterium CG10_big_fil_rev_8_21_14_0_10_54_11]
MASRGFVLSACTHKHAYKQTTRLLSLLTFMAISGPLPLDPQALLAAWPAAVSDKESTTALPDYSDRLGSAAVAHPPVRTEEAVWTRPVRLAAAPTVPRLSLNIDGSPAIVLEGEASYYSRAGCLGCNVGRIMANGQPLNDGALTMAIGANLKHLVGRKATVTSLLTGQSVQVIITDTGGFYQAKYGNRVADLSVATKQAIGMAGGVGQVRVEVH